MKSILRTLVLCLSLAITSHLYAQNPLTQKNLSAVSADDVTEEQLIEFVQKAKTSGLNEEQITTLLTNRGLPAAEVTTLKDRIANLQINSAAATTIQTPVVDKNPDLTPKSAARAEVGATPTAENPNQIFGHQFFKNNSFQTFEKGSDAKAPENYIIGTGDEFALSVFGYSDYNEVVKFYIKGFIKPKNGGPIHVKGMPYDKAKSLIRSKLSNFFDLSNNQVTINLTYSRIITINIVGEVDKPGSYKMPAVNTAFNALIAVGGPTNLGTVRNIQIKRNGKLIKTLDVYEFLANPNSKQDYFLEDNDFILIPPAVKFVKISGEVKRPMIYELLPKENLNDLINLAGGMTSKVYTKLFTLNRLSEDGKQRQILNYSLDSLISNKKTFALKDGDDIALAGKSEELSQFVEVQGAVYRPGRYQLIDGEKVTDLIRKANGLRTEAKVDKAFLIRILPDLTKDYISISLDSINKDKTKDLVLQKGDFLSIASNADFADVVKVEAIGLFRKPGPFDYHKGMTLGDMLFLAGGLKTEADVLHIEVSRISLFAPEYKPGEASRVNIKILEVGKNIQFTDEQLKFELAPYDQVFVRLIPDFEYQKNFTIQGEVKYPGIYALSSKEEHLSELIKRAGGLNKFAFAEGATLNRPNLPGSFIVMNLKEALKNTDSKYNYILNEGDVLTIPKVIDLIAIQGSVQYLELVNIGQVNVPYVAGRRANYYINEFANGWGDKSWRRKTYTIDHNYKVNRTKNFLFFNIYPKVKKGATIYVINRPVKEKKKKDDSKPVDWNKSISDFTVKLTGLATLYILLRAAGVKF